MANIQNRKIVPEGQTIFREGDTGDRAFLVEKGEVEISKMVDGEKLVLGTVKPGGIFGEMALVDRSPRMASAAALEPTSMLVISEDVFQEKMANADPFIRALLRIFVRNIRRSAEN